MQNTHYSSSNSIDLFDLFANLWKNKLIIFIATCIGIVVSANYAFTTKEEWSSEAQIISPESEQLSAYLDVLRGYYRFGDITANLNIDSYKNDAYKTLVVMLKAVNSKHEYLKNTPYYIQQEIKLELEKEKQNLLLEGLVSNLQIKETNKGDQSSYNISFTAETASEAQQTLQGYIESVNREAINKLFDDLHALINERILTLEYNANNLKEQAEQTRKNNILAIEQAVKVARDAGINEYISQGIVTANTRNDLSNSLVTVLFDSENLFLLGEKYLTAQLNTLKSSPIIYPIAYYQILKNINDLKQLLSYEAKGVSFEYTRLPSLPLSKDKPRKSFILIFGALIGGMLGCCIVLIRNAINYRQKR